MTINPRPQKKDIPTQPGVYRFFDERGSILYVGKAKNLRNRLSSYFVPEHSLHERTRQMVSLATKVEWVIVGSVFEALQLEFTWIKEFSPPFNIQFKDDKSYPYLALTVADSIPRVLITRNKNIAGARYFGPYTKTWAIRETLDQLLPVFPIRSCNSGTFNKASRDKRPCLLGDIGRCSAPCADRISPADHKSLVRDFISFMSGNNEEYVLSLKKEMNRASEKLEYERAAQYRDKISALESVAAKSAVVLADNTDIDIFGISRDELNAAVQQFIVRGGRIRGVKAWTVDTELDVNIDDFIDHMLRTAYDDESIPPKEIVVPHIPQDAVSIQFWLSELRKERVDNARAGSVRLRTAQRGDIAALAATVRTNAEQALIVYKTKRSQDYVARTKALNELQSALNLEESPLRIECFDVSHLGGSHIVGSMVVFEDGLPKKRDYKKFSIGDFLDDTAALRQIISRRIAYLDNENQEDQSEKSGFSYPPSLFIVDGGVPQVNAAARVLKEHNVDIPVVGIAKKLEELWLSEATFPRILPRNSEALFLVQQIRDEAHRFAITFQRTKRKNDIRTVLTDIPGVGTEKAKSLLRHFASVSELKKATVEEIAQVKGINTQLARKIAETLSGRNETTS